jgi:hypothetical protein
LDDDFLPIAVHFTVARAFGLQGNRPVNLVARQDRVPLGGLAVAVIVLVAWPIRHLLDLNQPCVGHGLQAVPVPRAFTKLRRR